MNEVKSLFKLECKLARGKGSKSKRLLSNIFSCLGLMLFVAAFAFMFTASQQYIGDVTNIVGNLSLVVLILQAILFLYSISNQQKNIFLYKDKLTLAYLPVSKWHIYLAKSLKCLLDVYIVNFIISIPTLLMFGFLFVLPAKFFGFMFVVVLLLPMLPFGIANLCLIPLMMFHNFLKNKSWLRLILSIVITVVVFYLYIKLVFNVANIILLQDSSAENLLQILANFSKSPFLPSTWISMFLLETNVLYLILIFSVSLLVAGVAVTIGCVTYKNIFNRAVVERTVAKVIPTKLKQRKAFNAYFITEFKDIFRNTNYSYTYFGMAIAMPLMVYSCGKFMIDFAVERIGENIIFGTTLLVILIFISIICSPTAAFISKEGDGFWILKTNPRGINLPLFAKSMVGVISSVTALLVTIIILASTGMISVLSALYIFVLSSVYIVGLVALGLVLNLYRPNLFYSNIENNSNLLIHMLVGFVLSIAIGVLAIFTSFSYQIIFVALFSLAVISIFTAIVVAVLLSQSRKLYANMEA